MRRKGPQGLVATLAIGATVWGLFLPSASAQTVTLEVIADGLDNPRGISLNDAGGILITESGRGGECERVREIGRVCFGMTASITRVASDGTVRTVVRLPSVSDNKAGIATSGASDVALEAGKYYVAMGEAPPGLPRVFGDEARWFNDLVRAKPLERLAELGRFEAKHNPANDVIESNPYSVARVDGGTLVADAAGNSLILVPDEGRPSVVATFPTQELQAPDGSTIDAHAVPNALKVGPDGAYYVGQLTGFPFTLGSSRVWRIEAGTTGAACDAEATTGPCTLYAEGLTALIDIAFGPDDKLYVLEITKNGLLQAEGEGGDFTGALLRMDGTTFTEIASEGLIAPAGVVVSPEGRIFVTNYGIFPGQGQVVEVIQGP